MALPGFVGRQREIAVLSEELTRVRRTGQGAFVMLRGRRRVGKSWLAEEFVLEQRLPHVFFTATRNRVVGDLDRFAERLSDSSLPESARGTGLTFRDWESALVTASNGADPQAPSVIIIDEFPYLGGDDPDQARAVELLFSAAWERRLSRLPVILIVIGSDLAMMERLSGYGRPLYDRPTRTLVLDPLSLADIATITSLPPEDVIDTYAITGGLPAFALARRQAGDLRSFLRWALSSADTPFVSAALRIFDAEFPSHLQARSILSAIGYGERTRQAISNATGTAASNLQAPLEYPRPREADDQGLAPIRGRDPECPPLLDRRSIPALLAALRRARAARHRALANRRGRDADPRALARCSGDAGRTDHPTGAGTAAPG